MTLHVPGLVSPRELPDGTVSWEEQEPELGQLVRDGDPRTGWLGDPQLSLNLNTEYVTEAGDKVPRWEIWRRHEAGNATLVCHVVGYRPPAGRQVTEMLALHDSRTHDIAAQIIKDRNARRERVAKEQREQFEDSADKLAWALGRDLGAPAQSGRVFGTSR